MFRPAPKLVVICSALVASLVLMMGCVSQSEYDAKAAELKRQTDNLNRAQQEAAQLQKDLGDARGNFARANQAKTEAEGKIGPLEQQLAQLKKQADKVPQLEKEIEQLKKDLDAAKGAAQAKTEAENKIKALEQQNAELKKQADKVSQLEKEIAQLKKDLETTKANQAKK